MSRQHCRAPLIPFDPPVDPLVPRKRTVLVILLASALFGLGWAKTDRLFDWPTAPAGEAMPVAP